MPAKLKTGANETVLLIPVIEIDAVPHLLGSTTIAPYTAPTSAILNKYIDILDNNDTGWGAGGNVTCALRDDMTLGMTDSDTDDDRSLCSTSATGAFTFFNFEAEFNIFRDASVTEATSVYNMAKDLIQAPDIPYIIAHRIGYSHTTDAAPGQEWDFYYVWTDNPVPVYSDGGNQLITQTFVSKNIINIGYELAA